MTRHRFLLVLSCFAVSCGGSSPSAPGSVPSPTASAFRGETLSAIDGRPIGGLTVKIGSQTARSDQSGRFELQNLRDGADTLVVSGSFDCRTPENRHHSER